MSAKKRLAKQYLFYVHNHGALEKDVNNNGQFSQAKPLQSYFPNGASELPIILSYGKFITVISLHIPSKKSAFRVGVRVEFGMVTIKVTFNFNSGYFVINSILHFESILPSKFIIGQFLRRIKHVIWQKLIPIEHPTSYILGTVPSVHYVKVP